MFRLLFLLISLTPLSGCKNTEVLAQQKGPYKTNNVVVIVVDGPRYSETWGDKKRKHVPYLAKQLAKEGIINTAFFNDGFTYTNAGHAAITTGVRQGINNQGQELPRNPSFFQHWLEKTGNSQNKAWIVTSKDKLHILADTKQKDYRGKFLPAYNSGMNGPNTGYREDSVTLRVAKQILSREKPNLMLVNFKEPDAMGHSDNWKGYLKGIEDTDKFVYELWKFLENDPHYQGTTTIMLTNDHGRHLDGHRDGFVSHGDNCDGCRHLVFYATGPDFKENALIDTPYNQTDIPATIAELLGFTMPESDGQVMWKLFKED